MTADDLEKKIQDLERRVKALEDYNDQVSNAASRIIETLGEPSYIDKDGTKHYVTLRNDSNTGGKK